MQSRCPLPLYPQPPFSPCQTQDEPPSDESDFPPIRIREDVDHESTVDTPSRLVSEHVDLDFPPFPAFHEHSSTPDLPTHSPTNPHLHSELQSPPGCFQPLKKGLGRKNILNTTHAVAQQSKSLKRKRLESSQVTKEHLSKRRRLTFDKTDMDWLKDEIHGIKLEIGELGASIMKIADRLRTQEDFNLEDILFPI